MRLLLLICLIALAWPALADDRGLAVFQAEYAASRGYGDLVADVKMTLVSKKGRVSLRQMRLRQMEAEGSVKTLVVFDEPKAIRGTGLLTYSHPMADDDQWLYLPRLKRVKKIASRDRSGPFVGSEFAYEDLADYVLEEFSYTWLRQAPCGELTCDVVERVPVDPYSGYSKQVVWVDQERSRMRIIEYFDEDGAPLKTMIASDFRDYVVGDRTYHQPHVMQVQNVQTGRSTKLEWLSYAYGQEFVDSRDFTRNALQRVR